MKPLLILILVVAGILSLPFLFPEKALKVPDDATLRHEALSHNLLSVPTEREEMLKLVDSPANPMSEAKVALGKRLFFDPRLSKDGTINCASCHILEAGGDDNRPTAIGYYGRPNPRHLNSPTVLNAALQRSQFWDGRAKDVEEQAGGPIQAPFEMNMTPEEVVARLRKDPSMVEAFAKVFGEGNLTFAKVRNAIGAYERTLLTRSPFDDFLDGNDSALSPEAKRGLTLFMERGCKGCHTGMSVGGQLVKRFPLRRYLSDYLGVWFSPNMALKRDEIPFDNVGGFTGRDGRYFFKVPLLRNVARTGPYFHNGAIEDLHEAVRIMSKYQLGKEFTPDEINATVAFLKSLGGKIVDYGY
ncbi:cytochrome-c peroxidase [Nitratifractor sp.]